MAECRMNLAAITKGVLVRLLFALHTGVCVLLVVNLEDSSGNRRLWPIYMYAGFVVLMLMEACWCLCVTTHGYNWKLFSPTVALYIVCTAVCFWSIELWMYDMRKMTDEGDTSGNNSLGQNKTSVENPVFVTISIFAEYGWILTVVLPLRECSELLLQLMIFILVIGRWLLPKGNLSRDQLSQLLLVQIAMGADILELFGEGMAANFKDKRDVVLVLIVWSWSLPQFTLSLTLTKSKKLKLAARPEESVTMISREGKDYYGCHELCCATEMWSVFLSAIVMQDLPFLTLRLYLTYIKFSDASGSIFVYPQTFFFSCKNLLVILLQIYRMAVIVAENRRKKKAWKLALKGIVSRQQNPPHQPDMAEQSQSRWDDCGESRANGVWHTENAQAWAYPPLSETGDMALRRRDVGSQTDPY